MKEDLKFLIENFPFARKVKKVQFSDFSRLPFINVEFESKSNDNYYISVDTAMNANKKYLKYATENDTALELFYKITLIRIKEKLEFSMKVRNVSDFLSAEEFFI